MSTQEAFATVHIWRASPGSMSGEINDVGVFRLPVLYVHLGARKTIMWGNGTPTAWIDYSSEIIACVAVNGLHYALMENEGPSVASRKIIVHHDADLNDLDQEPCPACGAVKTSHIKP